MSQKTNQISLREILFQIQKMDNSDLFRQALAEDSNQEDMWLWYASEMQSPLEKQYCLRRALYINPQNEETRYQIGKLNTVVAGQAKHKQSVFARLFVTLFNNSH